MTLLLLKTNSVFKQKLLLFLIVILLSFSCSTKIENIYTEVPVLRASAIYNDDEVYSYVRKYKDVNKKMSDSYIQKSKDIEQTDLHKAIYFAKRSITLFPEVENYKILLALLNKNKNYKEMNKLCSFINSIASVKQPDGSYIDTALFGPPSEDIYYEYIVSQIAEYGKIYGQDIYIANENGFNLPKIKQQLFSDKRIGLDMTTEEGKSMLFLFMTPQELEAYNNLKSTFKDFLTAAENHSPVFEINKNNISKFNYDEFNGRNSELFYDNEIAWEQRFAVVYRKYLVETKKDPNKWIEFNLKNFVEINENVMALVYAVDSSATACPVDMRHIYYRLITYSPNAKIIDSKIIAIQSGEQLTTVDFINGKMNLINQKRVWKNAYDKNDFNNFLVKIEYLGETKYEIQSDGKILEITSNL